MVGKVSIVCHLADYLSLHLLYFAIRRIHFPRLYLQHRYGQIIVWGVIFVAVAFMLSQFPTSRRSVIAAGPRIQSAPAETDCVAALRRCMRIRTLHRTHLGTLQADMGKKRDRDAEEQGRTAIVQGTDQPPFPVQHPQHDLRPRGHQVGQGREALLPSFPTFCNTPTVTRSMKRPTFRAKSNICTTTSICKGSPAESSYPHRFRNRRRRATVSDSTHAAHHLRRKRV